MLKNTRWEAKICIFVGSSYAVCHESTKIICSAVYKMIKPVSLVQKCYETSILYRDKSQASLVQELRSRSTFVQQQAAFLSFCTLHRIFVLSGMAIWRTNGYFFLSMDLYTLLSGSNSTFFGHLKFKIIDFLHLILGTGVIRFCTGHKNLLLQPKNFYTSL